MVAAMWAGHRATCPLAVNVDGHGNPTRPEQFLRTERGPVAYQSLLVFLGNAVEESPEPLAQLMSEVNALDLLAMYRATRGRVLVVSGAAEGAPRFLPEPLGTAWQAYHGWVQRELAAVARDVPLVSVASLPTGHDVHLDDPDGLLRLVVAHLRAAGPAGRATVG